MDAGNGTTCVVTRSGALGCWGIAVGDGSTELPHSELTWVSDLGAVETVDVTSAVSNGTIVLACAILKDGGTVACWRSRETPKAVANLTGVSAVAAGSAKACAIRNGEVLCWDIGNQGPTTPSPVAGLAQVEQIAMGDDHACARLASGAVHCWGGNVKGQLGASGAPAVSQAVPGIDAIDVSAGLYQTCAIQKDRSVRCWGYGAQGSLGDGDHPVEYSTSTPVKVVGIASAATVSVGFHHACASLTDLTVACWGSNSNGQLGSGSTASSSSVPVKVAGLTGALRVSVGDKHACAAGVGFIKCWGAGQFGQLGHGDLADSKVPVDATAR
jgi:alpha-tubulin suppressor-like RCC1 family protein